MSSTFARRSVRGRTRPRLVPPFDGYPYLVTRIGHSALRHIALVPAVWPRDRLLDLARRQRDANRLDTCLALAPRVAVYCYFDGSEAPADYIPTGLPVTEALQLAESFPETAELAERRVRLTAYANKYRGTGYLVGDNLEGGRPACPDDIERLSGTSREGVPAGLRRCPTCGWFAGDYLARRGEGNGDMNPRVVEVNCRCANHNRCAACGEALAASRLSAYRWDESERKVWYLAAYAGLGHRCDART